MQTSLLSYLGQIFMIVGRVVDPQLGKFLELSFLQKPCHNFEGESQVDLVGMCVHSSCRVLKLPHCSVRKHHYYRSPSHTL